MHSESSEPRILISELERLANQGEGLLQKESIPVGYVDMWVRRLRSHLRAIYGKDSSEIELIKLFNKIDEKHDLRKAVLVRLEVFNRYINCLKSIANITSTRSSAMRVFIGHGRSPMWRELKDFIVDDLKLPYDEFDRVSVAGRTIVDRLNEMLEDAVFALLVLTAEDQQRGGETRARQNVIHEAGLFQGRLGFNRAILLVEEGVEEFSNSTGLVQIRFPPNHISAVFHDIRRVFEQSRIDD